MPLGWLTALGRGFSHDAHKTVLEYGFSASTRGQRGFGIWALWLEARADLWPAPERVGITDVPGTVQLPKLDVVVSFGVSLLAFR